MDVGAERRSCRQAVVPAGGLSRPGDWVPRAGPEEGPAPPVVAQPGFLSRIMFIPFSLLHGQERRKLSLPPQW